MKNKYSAIKFSDKLSLFNDYWSPKVIAELNEYQFKLAKLKGEFVWHSHTDSDEAFIIIKGRLRILFRDGVVDLSAGEMFVVPKGKEHKPVAAEECHILLIEPGHVSNTGEIKNELTAQKNVWV